ncbi:cysteine desulfurase/selenocysteine lyase [Allocatelliglobosispora scoriae]|uniref:cysteine desulfurase n=1 Tax=Allocatelliglobosispora scoriae TaxID=643052 RepID=A0A841BHD9_9ACTN|nr:family 2A encapsulin nanocompartment cargo protein cysteine desulfurase [Allocatelliglobosispora scoriae]MBB5867704.1 cysteine desulfurase/selenocysteine lyase [Allocatelliglobosispora scoriae]
MTDVPPGLPDEATMNRLAGEFFAALPGSDSAPGPLTQALAPAPQTAEPTPAVLAALAALASSGGLQGPQTPAVGAVSAASGLLVPSSASYYFLTDPQPLTSRPTSVPAPDYSVPRLAPQTPPAPSAPPSPVGDTRFYFTEFAASSVPAWDVAPAGPTPAYDLGAVRRDFPILAERVNGRQLVWLDNAATTQKPQAVIDRLAYFYAHENSNIHRAAHELAARATDAYEGARSTVARFIGAASADSVIFVRGATEAVNLVAQTWGRQHIGTDDEIVISHLEHHANIVPWQQLAAEKGAKLRVIPVDDDGQIRLDEFGRMLNDRTKLVAVTHVSNALGTVVPIDQVIAMAHRAGARVLIDGAQSVAHKRIDVQAQDPDFFVFSGHKVFAPTGIGVVYAKPEVLESMPPWQFGGNMIEDVSFDRSVFQQPPARFEAGTGNIADAVGLGAALEYLESIGLESIDRYEHDLLGYATQAMRAVPGLRLIGTAAEKASVLSFVLEGYRTEEVGSALNREGIAVRSGHHCAQPILRRFGLESTVRPSLALYNTCDEVDLLVAALHRLAANVGRRR